MSWTNNTVAVGNFTYNKDSGWFSSWFEFGWFGVAWSNSAVSTTVWS
jgi:hypothetical protein